MGFSISRSLVFRKALAVCAVTATLCAPASCAEANGSPHNSPRSASAALHLTVFVVPVVRASEEVVPKREDKPIIFRFAAPPLTQTYEVRTLPSDEHSGSGKQERAVLRTLT